MRYLYGDSHPFQLQYNFLATLETFVSCAARAVQVEREAAILGDKHAAERAARERSLDELEAFHGSIAQAVATCASRATSPETREFAESVAAHASQLLEEGRRAASIANERAEAVEENSADKRRDEARKAIEKLLLTGRLPSLEARVHHQLVDGHNVVNATFANPQHIVTEFTLAPMQAPPWRRERKVSDFVRGLTVQVGMKKSLFKRTMQPEVVQLDEFVIGGFDLSDDAAEIRLRKRADGPDALIFHLRRDGDDLFAEVVREGEEGALPVDAGDRAALEQFWQLLRAGVGEVLTHKERLVKVELDGADLFEADLVSLFVTRIVKLFAPIVAEIAKRSPNPAELSLKHEDDGGRREEIYVKKKDLLDEISPLDATGQALFAPLWAVRDEATAEVAGRDEMPSLDISLDTMEDA